MTKSDSPAPQIAAFHPNPGPALSRGFSRTEKIIKEWKEPPQNSTLKARALTVSRVNRRNSALADALRPAPNFTAGGRAWVYNSSSTIRQGVKASTDAKVLKAKLHVPPMYFLTTPNIKRQPYCTKPIQLISIPIIYRPFVAVP